MPFSQISQSPTRDKYPLSRKKITKKAIGTTIVFFFLFIWFIFPLALLGISFFSALIKAPILAAILGPLAFILSIAIVYWIAHTYQTWYFNTYFYELTPDYIIIKKGVFTPKEINIPYERVQDVYVDQDILDRMFGLFDVHISSATVTSGMAAHIDGVEKEAADGLRETLLNTVQHKIRGPQAPQTQTPPSPAPNQK